jgi:hypothetical protein
MTQLHPVASTALVIFYVLSALLLVGLIGAAAYLILRLNRLLTEYQQKIDPILVKADQALTIIADKADSIGGKAETLLAQSEEVAESVHEKVDRTAVAVQRTINAPIIGANSLVAGFTRGFLTFARLQRRTVDADTPDAALLTLPARDEEPERAMRLEPLPLELSENGGAEMRNASSLTASEEVDTSNRAVQNTSVEPVVAGLKRER